MILNCIFSQCYSVNALWLSVQQNNKNCHNLSRRAGEVHGEDTKLQRGLGTDGFYFFYGFWNRFSQNLMTFVGNQNIVLYPDTSNRHVGVNFIVIDVFFEFPFGFPLSYQFRYEIASGFNSKYMTWFIRQGKPEKCRTKLFASFHLIIITNIVFTKTFHIVNVQTHHMTKSVRHE